MGEGNMTPNLPINDTGYGMLRDPEYLGEFLLRDSSRYIERDHIDHLGLRQLAIRILLSQQYIPSLTIQDDGEPSEIDEPIIHSISIDMIGFASWRTGAYESPQDEMMNKWMLSTIVFGETDAQISLTPVRFQDTSNRCPSPRFAPSYAAHFRYFIGPFRYRAPSFTHASVRDDMEYKGGSEWDSTRL